MKSTDFFEEMIPRESDLRGRQFRLYEWESWDGSSRQEKVDSATIFSSSIKFTIGINTYRIGTHGQAWSHNIPGFRIDSDRANNPHALSNCMRFWW